MKHVIPETIPEYDEARIVQRPDGFYWQFKSGDEEFGPFPTLLEAVQDMQFQESNLEQSEILAESEAEIGIADWIDPETGLPAEESIPRLEEH